MENWHRERLHGIVADLFSERKLIVVSNREPYIHTHNGREIQCMTPASGVTAALDPILRAAGGVWVAHGSGNADRETTDPAGRVAVPPGDPSYTLRRVWLPWQIEQEYYYGLANEGLWPLCHIAFHRPKFDAREWSSYRTANAIFADAVLEEAAGGPALVLVQDYHLALLPRMLKQRNPNLTVAQFWHIPWPNRETFRAFPWKDELLDGLLGNDLLGFHLRVHCANFLETIERELESRVDLERSAVDRNSHTTLVRAFPISIDFEEHAAKAASTAVAAAVENWRKILGRQPELLGIGIDRIDYTKGIPERMSALDRLFEEHPEYIGRLVFVQVGVPSRSGISAYDELNRSLAQKVDQINKRWGRGPWRPIVFVPRHQDQISLMALHQMADFCLVSSLHDGMNLVAKEFVASRIDGDGVLILSAFTGSARELVDALIVNPFSADDMAEAMHSALNMPAPERRRRMNRMRGAVAANNVYRWAGKILLQLCGLDSAASDSPETEEPLTASASCTNTA